MVVLTDDGNDDNGSSTDARREWWRRQWCAALAFACSLVVGKRSTRLNGLSFFYFNVTTARR
jgi:hypothetical protein